jgi:lipopolysaccharide/colanic/teichoic acid biosynthesis glycosyltransferase
LTSSALCPATLLGPTRDYRRAQVNGRKELPWDKRFEYDLEYVDHCSFGLDLKIFCKTFGKLVSFADNVNTSKTA